jgi:Pyridoxamine 5'-phosphate oxidase
MTPPPRTQQQRKQDALKRLEQDTDAWVATAEVGSGTPYLVPLSYLWDGATLLVATPASSPTGRNLRNTGKVRLGIGPTRDVVLIEGTAHALAAAEVPPEEVGDAFAAKTGFDPRELTRAPTSTSASTRGGSGLGAKSTNSRAASSCAADAGSSPDLPHPQTSSLHFGEGCIPHRAGDLQALAYELPRTPLSRSTTSQNYPSTHSGA